MVMLRCTRWPCWALTVLLACACTDARAAKLTKKEYSKHSASMGVVLFDVNWGRRWGCDQHDNAQLLKLVFENTKASVQGDAKYSEIEIKTPSKLFVDPVFLSYGFIVTPGIYEFTGWSVKVATSMQEVWVADVGREQMVQGDDYLGGSFSVAAGEVVYVGNFWVDCGEEPIPWRYFTEWGEQWDEHRRQYATQFKFLQGQPIRFGVLDTPTFGHHPLMWRVVKGNLAIKSGEYAEAIDQFEQLLTQAEAVNEPSYSAIAMFSLGRANGFACNYALGVSWFEKSIVLKQSLPDQKGVWLSQNYLELGRLHASREDWPDMIHNFELGIPLLDQANMVESDPIGYAGVLEALQVAYRAVGSEAQAGLLATRIAAIRVANPGKKADFTAEIYPTDCG